MDGKQARRTGNSSPLGLLFDHGADSLNTILLALSACSIMQVGPTWYFAAFVVSMAIGFYFATLEVYYVGKLDLPVINAVSDGCVLVFAICILSAITGSYICHKRVGSSMWRTIAIGGVTRGQLILSLATIVSLPVVLMKYSPPVRV